MIRNPLVFAFNNNKRKIEKKTILAKTERIGVSDEEKGRKEERNSLYYHS